MQIHENHPHPTHEYEGHVRFQTKRFPCDDQDHEHECVPRIFRLDKPLYRTWRKCGSSSWEDGKRTRKERKKIIKKRWAKRVRGTSIAALLLKAAEIFETRNVHDDNDESTKDNSLGSFTLVLEKAFVN